MNKEKPDFRKEVRLFSRLLRDASINLLVLQILTA